MEIISPHIENFRDVKICRLCGSIDKNNIDIFTKPISSRSEDLLTKILAVYPLVLYKDDPLPQYICPKCIGNVSKTFQDIQQVMRQQNKWISFTKAVRPEHKYFRILNVVENSTKATKETIKTSYNIEINNIPLEKLLATTSREKQNTTTIKNSSNDNVTEVVVKNIKNKLESNGFTITRIKVPTSPNNSPEPKAITDSAELIENDLETRYNFVTCNYCKEKLPDIKNLAEHQLVHLKLNVNKMFEKHILPKQLRRGRLVTINDNRCIRCLNCWRIYTDNKVILQHWSKGECEFYCFVCGKEFPHSPKMLREHVTETHGISYRSIKSEFMTKHSHLRRVPFEEAMATKTQIKSIKRPPPKSCTKNDDGTITCKICHKVFDNFRSSNSHMRKHKPPNPYRQTIVAKNIAMDKYNTEDGYDVKPSTSSYYNYNAPTRKYEHKKLSRGQPTVFMENDPLPGIKTKNVQKRHDILTKYAANQHHLTQSSMASTPDVNDNDNLIVPELLTTINPEHMQKNIFHNDGSDDLEREKYSSKFLARQIKAEPLDEFEYIKPEPQFCFVCNENFLSARDFELHEMFVHNTN